MNFKLAQSVGSAVVLNREGPLEKLRRIGSRVPSGTTANAASGRKQVHRQLHHEATNTIID
jgi:hypothetical protein